ncbi:MAG: thioredoxin [Bacteroidetes bacterium]|nr:thioredoxin [Bacteroidota bacterium]
MANFKSVVESSELILVDFHAEWCGPCKMMPPILSDVKSQMGEDVKIIKIDIDKNASLAQDLHVRSVPTLMVFKNGKSIWRQSGVVQANDLVNILRSA